MSPTITHLGQLQPHHSQHTASHHRAQIMRQPSRLRAKVNTLAQETTNMVGEALEHAVNPVREKLLLLHEDLGTVRYRSECSENNLFECGG